MRPPGRRSRTAPEDHQRKAGFLASWQDWFGGNPGGWGTAWAVHQARGPRRAAGIYGTIVTAAIIAAAGGRLPTLQLAVSVLVTLLVYWVAEEYAELLGEQVEGGRLPTWPHVRAALAATWPMVSASYLPLLSLVLARLAGASGSAAANVGLAVAVVLLVIHGLSAGRAARLHGGQLVAITSAAAGLGLVMVVLKDVILIHLH